MRVNLMADFAHLLEAEIPRLRRYARDSTRDDASLRLRDLERARSARRCPRSSAGRACWSVLKACATKGCRDPQHPDRHRWPTRTFKKLTAGRSGCEGRRGRRRARRPRPSVRRFCVSL